MSAVFSQTTRALAQDRPSRSLVAWAVAGTLMALWAAWFGLGRVAVFQVTQQARLEVQQQAQPLAAPVAARVRESLLVIGRTVKAGELLVALDDEEPALRQREEQARHDAAAAQLSALAAEVQAQQRAAAQDAQAAAAAVQAALARAQEAALAKIFATEQASRLAEDAAAGGTPLAQARQAEADARRAAATHDALLAEARRLQADAAARAAAMHAQADALKRQVATLEGEMAASAQALQRLALEVSQRRLLAPVAGRVGEVAPLNPGDVVAAGQRFASIVPEGRLRIVAEFEPAAFGRLQPGQPAKLRLAGFAWAQYGALEASVERVAGELREGRLRVELALRGTPPANLPAQHGLPGSVEVEVERLSPAALLLRAGGAWLAGGPST